MRIHKLFIVPAVAAAVSVGACADEPYEDDLEITEERLDEGVNVAEPQPGLQTDEIRDIEQPPPPLDGMEDDTLGTADLEDPNATTGGAY